MNAVDGSEQFATDNTSTDQSSALLTIILDTNPAAWTLLSPTLTLSHALANILIFINAHLACNYTNQVAVIASHCDKAQWLYPTAATQGPVARKEPKSRQLTRTAADDDDDDDEDELPIPRNKRAKTNGTSVASHGDSLSLTDSDSNKYRPFRLIEQELIRNLRSLMSSTSPAVIHETTSTMIAGALSLALSYTNRRMQEYQESLTGVASNLTDHSAANAIDSANQDKDSLQSRILVITLSPSADLAHQYIPIMNSIFACQRLSIPVDVLQLPLPPPSDTRQRPPEPQSASADPQTFSQSSTVFLQQASDATHGVFIAANLVSDPASIDQGVRTTIAQHSMLNYLLTALLPNHTSRLHLITPTKVDVDFRAACFCHRNVISTGFVCSICLSIFCDQSLEILSTEGCITCGTALTVRADGVGGWAGGKRPIVIAPKKKKKRRRPDGLASEVASPRPGTPG